MRALPTSGRWPGLLLAALLVLAARPAAAQFTLSTDDLYLGTAVEVTLPAGADTLVVTYRPNSSIPVVERLPVTGGTVAWTPSQAGVVALSTDAATRQNVSVRFRTLPTSGLLVLVLAGSILFGGAIYAFIKLFQENASATMPERRPDT